MGLCQNRLKLLGEEMKIDQEKKTRKMEKTPGYLLQVLGSRRKGEQKTAGSDD